jgi:DNA-nicking Smr family endonuclease
MRRRDLSSEETALWKEVASSVKPLRRGAAKSAEARVSPKTQKPPKASSATRAARATPAESAPTKRKSATKTPSVFEGGDPRLDRKARSGRLAAERTLDLHGLTQDAAARRLHAFLEGAAADGVKCVRVITGKGAPDSSRRDPFAPERGVLRRRFLEWAEAPPLRGLIARITPAERGAGAGAFFVFVKSRRKT